MKNTKRSSKAGTKIDPTPTPDIFQLLRGHLSPNPVLAAKQQRLLNILSQQQPDGGASSSSAGRPGPSRTTLQNPRE